MPYQERQVGEASNSTDESGAPVFQAQKQPNSGRTVQVIIAVGLLAAIIVAIFGNY